MTKVSSPAPGSLLTPRHVRVLKISIAVMTALLLSGLVALVYGVVRQAKRLSPPAAPAAVLAVQSPYQRSLDLGQGKLEGISTSGSLLILQWKGEGSDIILTVDPRNGHELGRIQVPHRQQ